MSKYGSGTCDVPQDNTECFLTLFLRLESTLRRRTILRSPERPNLRPLFLRHNNRLLSTPIDRITRPSPFLSGLSVLQQPSISCTRLPLQHLQLPLTPPPNLHNPQNRIPMLTPSLLHPPLPPLRLLFYP
jgi:hypothetical protein